MAHITQLALGRLEGRKYEAAIWSSWLLIDPLVEAEWESRRGDRTEFSADDASQLLSSMAHELKALRTPACAELQRRIDVLMDENIELRRRLSEK